MSFNSKKIWALTGFNAFNKTQDEIVSLFHESLKEPMHGLCFSPYENEQKPGEQLSEEQVRKRLKIIQPHTNWLRSFSCTEGNELIPEIAHQMGMKTLVGAWLGKDKEINELEISRLIKLAKDGHVDIAVVGNEVLYRGDLTETELLDYINRVKKEIPEVSVGYVDAYYVFEPSLLNDEEILQKPQNFEYISLAGQTENIELQKNQLGFTFCQVPIVYSFSNEQSIIITMQNGNTEKLQSSGLSTEFSQSIFQRNGEIKLVEITFIKE